MKIIVPMAGMGKRMRPHTLTIPKPLIPVAGKPIVQRLVEDLIAVCNEEVDEIAFIIGRFGHETENQLMGIAQSLGTKGKIYYQDEALGTAHAILCAKPSLTGKVLVAFADTLFKADFVMDNSHDGVLWVQKIDDPKQFGVVTLNSNGAIKEFVEKPQEFVSDLAMIGIYYFKDGDNLAKELQYLIDNNLKNGGEYQLPDALRNMTAKGFQFFPGTVTEWLDCGNKNATVETNQRILVLKSKTENLIHQSLKMVNSLVVEPCYIGENVTLNNAIVGPYVSIGNNTKVVNSIIKNSIVQQNTSLNNVVIENSMVGNNVIVSAKPLDLSLGDYSTQNS